MKCDSSLRITLVALVAAMAVSAIPLPADAHLVTTGMGPVYDGIGHFLFTPEDLVVVLTLSLHAGLRGAAVGRKVMFLLPVAWFAGGVAGSVAGWVPTPLAPALSFMVLGGLVAADLSAPSRVVSALALIMGLVHGFFDGASLKDGAGTLGLMGITGMLFVLVVLGSAFVVSLEQPWMRIAVRVVGSWIAASGLLMLGWSLR